MKAMKFGVGQAVRRVEDVRLITGEGRYTSDYAPEGALYAAFLRSPHAHAGFLIGDLAAVQEMPGVKGVYCARDFAKLKSIPCVAPVPNSDGATTPLKPYPVIASGEVHHVGDIVAMAVASSAVEARDAAEAIPVDWTPLPAAVETEAAAQPGAPQVFAKAPNNTAYDNHIGDKSAVDAVFAKAKHVVSVRIVNPRVVANYMEPRGAVAEYDASADHLTLNVGSQGVHSMQGMIAKILGVELAKLRVITTDVGGGFGTKGFVYREYPLILEAARRLKAAIRWQADRSEHFTGDTQGRDNVATAEMALDGEGRFLAMRVDIIGNLGAYLSQFAPYIPWLGATMATGPYDIQMLYARARGVYTHTVPVDAYRGAGRPEAAYLLERLVDQCGRKLALAPDEIRARNFVKPRQMPYKTPTDRTYDVGDFEGAMRACFAKADYAGFAARAAEAKARGKWRGFGVASYIECTAWGEGEKGSVTLDKSGDFTVLVGTQSNGQGHETAYAQVVSQYFDVPLSRIKVVQGDTNRVATGGGTGGSRSIPVGAVMVDRSSRQLAVSLKALAADKLEAAASDLEISDGMIRIAGTDRAISYAELAALPGASEQKLKSIESFDPPEATYPNGTHICEIEIDADTGASQIIRYTVVDDFGFTINPLLLEGQVHGGIAQGIGQALLENAVYGEDGQLLTASFMDYGMPRADSMTSFHFETRNIPSTTNPMGLKGAGEAGSIGSTPAVVNAVIDALWRGCGVDHIDMPATPLAIYRAMSRARAGR